MVVSHQPIIELFATKGYAFETVFLVLIPFLILILELWHISALVSQADNVPSESKTTPTLGASFGGDSRGKPVNVINNGLGTGAKTGDGDSRGGPAERKGIETGAADGAASFKTSFDCLDWLWGLHLG